MEILDPLVLAMATRTTTPDDWREVFDMADLAASDAADLEIASQPEAAFVRACAEAGCTLSEVQALAKETGHAN